MFTTDCVKAEVTYRRERLTRDYGRRTSERTWCRRIWPTSRRSKAYDRTVAGDRPTELREHRQHSR